MIAKVKETIPNKPIRYLVNTHVHFDHSGGLRTYVDEGATIVTHEMNKPYYEQAWAAPHTLNPDRLAQSKKTATFETFTDKHVLTDGSRSIEIHQIAGSGHNDAFAMVYLPKEKILIEGDAYTPLAAERAAAGGAEPVRGQPGREHPAAEAGRAADRGAARAAGGHDGRPEGVHRTAQHQLAGGSFVVAGGHPMRLAATAAGVALLLVLSAALDAQWLKYPTPGIPRLPDGKPNLSAPAPRTADGRPDLSGLWRASVNYISDLTRGAKPGDVVLLPATEALVRQRRSRFQPRRSERELHSRRRAAFESGQRRLSDAHR